MTKARLAELERRYKYLEKEIAEAELHWPVDDLMIADLKRRKLYIRDEIEQLRLRLVLMNWNAGTRALNRRSSKVRLKDRQTNRRSPSSTKFTR
jgi:hypothetical protein